MSDSRLMQMFKKHVPNSDTRIVQRDDGSFEFVDYVVEAMYKAYSWGHQAGYREGYHDCDMDQYSDE
jgi:hypothetical protein